MYLLCDIGGTNIRMVAADAAGFLSEPVVFATPQDFKVAKDLFVKTIGKIEGHETATKIVCAFPGSFTKDALVQGAPNVPEWVDHDLHELFASIPDAALQIVNDADAAGIGEATSGAGKEYNRVLYLTMSTGVGGALVINKKIAATIEPGWQFVYAGGTQSVRGKVYDHIEYFISGKSLQQLHGKPAETISDPAVWDQVSQILAYGLYNMIRCIAPDVIVLGGSVMQSLDVALIEKYLHEIERELRQYPVVQKSALGDMSGLYGALHMVV